ncbi:MAG: PQQ-like beta-propeller repeat protein, partial [Thermoplasmatales archaeon]
IYFTSRDGHVYCLNDDGSLKWMSDRITAFDYGPVIGSDGTIYAVPRWDWLFAFNPDGSEKWRKELPIDSGGQVSIAPDGTLIVCGQFHGVMAVDPSDGSILWTYTAHNPVGETITNAAIGSDGTIFFGCINYLSALNPDGTLKWKEHLSTDVFPYMFMYVDGDPSISNDGTVYVTSWLGTDFHGYYDIGYIHAIGMGDPDAPSTPVVSGKNYGLPLLDHWFSIKATSPSDKDVFYMVDWGDGNVEDWAGPYDSGEMIMVKHSWEMPSNRGEYFQVSARAKDTDGLLSPWGEFEIKISYPRNNVFYNSVFLRFLECFPMLERLLGWIR